MRWVLLACLTACGSFGTTAEPTDGGSTPATDPDGGNASFDASSNVDAAIPDADICVPRQKFTDGFERQNQDLLGGWNAYQNFQGTLSLDNILPLRGGTSLKVDLSMATATDGFARLTKPFLPGGTCPIKVAFVFKLKGFPTGSGGKVTIVQLKFANVGELELRLLDDQKFEIADDPDDLSANHLPIAFDNFVDEVVDASFVFDTKAKRVDYSLQRAGAGPVKGSVSFITNYGQPNEVVFGADNVQTTVPFAYFLDDLVIE